MVEMLYFVIGWMIVMAAIPVFAVLSLALAIIKRFVMRFHDPVEQLRFRIRLGGNIAYFIALLNAFAAVYYFIGAGLPVGARFQPWLMGAVTQLPEGWYIVTMFIFVIAGFVLKVTRKFYVAGFIVALFAIQVLMELAPTLFALASDPGLFARFIDEIARMHDSYTNVGGMPGTVMTTLFAGLIYGAAIQAAYYILAMTGLLIALSGTMRLRRFTALKFATPPTPG
jgi:hypothetical protein